MKKLISTLILGIVTHFLLAGATLAEDEKYRQNKPLIDAFWGTEFDGSAALEGAAIRRTLAGAEGIDIETLVLPHPAPVASVVIITGKSESFVKFKELAWDFHRRGYSVYMMDHRSQGLSGRLVRETDKVHVNQFSHYVDDFTAFMNEVVLPDMPEKLFLFAHSMGGAITGTYLLENQDVFDAVILDAPMIRFKTDGIPAWISEIIVKTAVKLGKGEEYVIGHRAWTVDEWVERMRATSSDARFNDFLELLIDNQEVLLSEAATNSWVYEGLKGTRFLRQNAEKITTPILLFQADDDAFVWNADQRRFCAKAKNCELVFVPGSQHEIYLERDSIRDPFLTQLFDFYARFLTNE